MTRKEAKSCIGTIEMLQRLAYNIHGVMDVIDADNCKKIIKALEQEPCEDAISRQSMLDAITEIDDNTNMDIYTNEVRDIIRDLPSVTPTRKKGKWIYNEKDSDLDYLVYSCSVCGRHVHIYLTNNNRCIEDYPYCHCGAYMKGEKE